MVPRENTNGCNDRMSIKHSHITIHIYFYRTNDGLINGKRSALIPFETHFFLSELSTFAALIEVNRRF